MGSLESMKNPSWSPRCIRATGAQYFDGLVVHIIKTIQVNKNKIYKYLIDIHIYYKKINYKSIIRQQKDLLQNAKCHNIHKLNWDDSATIL
jgi:hypothetical protein